jgi:hypothetical protein
VHTERFIDLEFWTSKICLRWFGFRLELIISTAQATSKNDTQFKVVKLDSKIIILLRLSKSEGFAEINTCFFQMDIGSSDLPVDFARFYRSSWLGTALLGSLACCGGDTWASELGTVLSKGDPFLITSFR